MESLQALITTPVIIATLISTVISGPLGYWLGMRKWKIEKRYDERRKLRESLIEMRKVWQEIYELKVSAELIEPEDAFLDNIPQLAKQHFSIDKSKSEFLQKAFERSLQRISENWISHHARLDRSLNSFQAILDELVIPISDDKSFGVFRKAQLLIPLLAKVEQELRMFILTAASDLSSDDRKEINKLVNSEMKAQRPPYQLPHFFAVFINIMIPFKQQVTTEEIQVFYSNRQIKWVLSKVITPGLTKKIVKKNLFSSIKPLIEANNEKNANELSSIMKHMILEIHFGRDEDQFFEGNKELYRLLLDFFEKVNGDIDYQLRRLFVNLRNGNIRMSVLIRFVQMKIKSNQTD